MSFFRAAREWCKGRSAIPRIPILVWFGWILFNHLKDPEYTSLFGGVNLGVHELGHVVFRPLGDFFCVIGGTFWQCMVPIIGMGMFLNQRDFFGIAFAFGWLATNFFGVALYASDARSMALPLVSIGGGDVYHDWNYILDTFNMLQKDAAVALGFRMAGIGSMVVCLLFGSWLCFEMLKSRNDE